MAAAKTQSAPPAAAAIAAAPAFSDASGARMSAPWYVPPWPVWLAIGLYVMAFWILYVLSPEKGKEPSELFKTLAGAIVLTAFVNGVVASVFAANRESSRKNDVIAAQARVIASQTPPSA